MKFEWTDKCEQNFRKLKEALCSAPVLAYPDFSKEFRIYCDASSVALGAVICQQNEIGVEQPISYYSRILNKSEKRYGNTERELLACHEGLKNFRSYLYGGECVVFTDHKAIEYLRNTENPSQRLAKWQYSLMGEIDWKVKYVPGPKNVVADMLSRIPDFSDSASESDVLNDSVWDESPPEICVVTRAKTSAFGKEKSESNPVSAPNQGDNSPGNLIKSEKCCDETDLRLNLDDLDDSGVNFDKDLRDRVIKTQDSDSMILKLKAFIEVQPTDKK